MIPLPVVPSFRRNIHHNACSIELIISIRFNFLSHKGHGAKLHFEMSSRPQDSEAVDNHSYLRSIKNRVTPKAAEELYALRTVEMS